MTNTVWKHSKYRPATEAMGAGFRAGVMERFGACSDDLVGLVTELCGEGDRDAGAEDWYFTAPSRVTYYMQRVVFAGFMADAAMVDAAIDADVALRDPAAADADRGPRGRGGRRVRRA